MHRVLLLGLLVLGLGPHARSQGWPRFRGPGGHGHGESPTIPATPTADDVLWRTDLAGTGHSSPVVWGERVFLTTVDGSQRHVQCHALDDGALQWRYDGSFRTHRQHRLNSFASSTPTVDADRVYVCWADGATLEVLALDHTGRPKWQRTIGSFQAHHGGGASPVLAAGVLVIANDHEGDGSFLLGLDPASGETLWKHERDSVRAAYSTPVLLGRSDRGGLLVFSSTAHGLTALDPADGKVAWEVDGLFEERCVGSPVIVDDVVFATAGSGGGGKESVALDLRGEGEPEVLYRLRRALPYVPTAVGYGRHLFTFSDSGILSCVEARTGEVLWQERLDAGFYGSPVCVNGNLYAVSLEGELHVVAATGEFQPLARVELGERAQASPAVAGGYLLVRTEDQLLALGRRPSSGDPDSSKRPEE